MKPKILFPCILLLIVTLTARCGDGSAFDITKNSLPIEWVTTTPFSVARGTHTSVAYNGYLYVIGGHNGTSYLSNVQYASINADGTVGTWNNTTPLTSVRGSHSSVVHNGYIYVFGGYGSPYSMNNVEYAQIKPDGSIGAWITTTDLTYPSYGNAIEVYNGYIYVVCGVYVEYALINADGSVGSWTSTNSLTTAGPCHSSVVYNGNLYVLGGGSGSNYLNNVLYAPINAVDNTIGIWNETTPFTPGRNRHTSHIYNGQLYILGGYDGTSLLDDVQNATFNADGTIGAWSRTIPFKTARHGHTSVIYNGYLYVIGGLLNTTTNEPTNDIQFIKLSE